MTLRTQMTDDELADAADRYETERGRWVVRTNKAFSPTRYEIVRRGDGPVSDETLIVKEWAEDMEVAHYEMELSRGVASMRAALADGESQDTPSGAGQNR